MHSHTLSVLVRKVAEGRRFTTSVLFVGIVAFYYFTTAGNLSETDDVYAFAYRAENFPITHISDPRLMLYHMLMRGLYVVGSAFSLDISALALMRFFSAMCAATALILVIRILTLNFKLSNFTAGMAAIVLGSSYGFWRYASEAEVYIPAILLCLLIYHLLAQYLDSQKLEKCSTGFKISLVGSVAGLGVLFYQPAVIPLFFAFPVLFITKEYKEGLVLLAQYLIPGSLVVGIGYLAGYFLYWQATFSLHSFIAFLSQRSDEFMIPTLSVKTVFVSLIRSAFSLSHDLVSANWIFGFDVVVQLINRAFSNNVIAEEVFLAQRAGWIVYFPIVSLILLLVVASRIVIVSWPLSLKRVLDTQTVTIIVWLLLYGAVVGRLNPAGIEAWIMALPPLMILLAVFLFEACVVKQKQSALMVFAGLLLVHNFVGGMFLVKNPEHEYDRVKGAWVISQATVNDLVIVTDNAGLAEAMRYLSKSQIALISSRTAPVLADALLNKRLPIISISTFGRDFGGQSITALIEQAAKKSGRIILFEEFYQTNNKVAMNLSKDQDSLTRLQRAMKRVHASSEVGSTYVMPANEFANR
ncbi:MAG: hypothetical protein FHK78_08460 [Sedimenticola selenatireducens]|nr:MAG: hypothetical protein FHK78_08460 [Sedimenticola selenatireducens]